MRFLFLLLVLPVTIGVGQELDPKAADEVRRIVKKYQDRIKQLEQHRYAYLLKGATQIRTREARTSFPLIFAGMHEPDGRRLIYQDRHSASSRRRSPPRWEIHVGKEVHAGTVIDGNLVFRRLRKGADTIRKKPMIVPLLRAPAAAIDPYGFRSQIDATVLDTHLNSASLTYARVNENGDMSTEWKWDDSPQGKSQLQITFSKASGNLPTDVVFKQAKPRDAEEKRIFRRTRTSWEKHDDLWLPTTFKHSVMKGDGWTEYELTCEYRIGDQIPVGMLEIKNPQPAQWLTELFGKNWSTANTTNQE